MTNGQPDQGSSLEMTDVREDPGLATDQWPMTVVMARVTDIGWYTMLPADHQFVSGAPALLPIIASFVSVTLEWKQKKTF